MVRVLVVDEQALFRAGIRHLLADADGFETVSQVESTERVLRTRSAANGAQHSRDDDDSVVAAMRAGASGYITKRNSERESLRVIRSSPRAAPCPAW
ncbi:hypothetical protein [Streptomyces sp. NBC_01716]|uniref:hypothetical protein n=1 Tax=Streptomyces sp. NBC_01716 TaxID=2975917 RepID=UPI002E37C128|nr:hypothetical protein [Streptomyces sp. NBC_01716]